MKQRFEVRRGNILIDTFEDQARAERYIRDWPKQGLQIFEIGLSRTAYLCD
jgi:hypothetical protein